MVGAVQVRKVLNSERARVFMKPPVGSDRTWMNRVWVDGEVTVQRVFMGPTPSTLSVRKKPVVSEVRLPPTARLVKGVAFRISSCSEARPVVA
jgi:hypothetical protein